MSWMSKEEITTEKRRSYGLRDLWNFIDEAKAEFKKISWTSRDELRVYTKIVVWATFIFGMGIYVADFFIQKSLYGMDFILKWLIG